LQRAWNIVRQTTGHDDLNSYGQTVSLCSENCQSITGTKKFQIDDPDRFYRFFIQLRSSFRAMDACVPIMELHGTFMKHDIYNGICIVVVARTADINNIP
jgi:hypothetical protein